jgi:hypothetical protein
MSIASSRPEQVLLDGAKYRDNRFGADLAVDEHTDDAVVESPCRG